MRTELRTPHVTVTPGRSVMIELEVANTTDIIDGITAIVDGLHPTWVRMPTPVLTLFPDATGTFPLHVTMPRDTVAGEYLVTVQVVSTVDPARTSMHDLWLTVEPHEAASMQVRPSVVIAGKRGEFDVLVKNDGNVETQYGVSVIDETRVAECRVEPLSVSVPPGQQGTFRVHASGPRPWFGQPVARALKITAASPTVTIEGTATFQQRARIARGLLTIATLAAIVALWATILVLGVGLLRDEQAPAKAIASNFNTNGTQDVPIDAIAASVTGTVTASSTGAGLERITVEAYRKTPDGYQVAGSAATADDGTYTLGALVPGTYTLRFTADGYDELWYPAAAGEGGAQELSLTALQEDAGRDVVLVGQPGSVIVTIESPDSQTPIQSTVTVVQVVEDAEQPVAGVSPDAAQSGPLEQSVTGTGQITIGQLITPGTYRITVASPGFQPQTFEETLAGGQDKVLNTVRLGAAPRGIAGRVVQSDGVTPLGNVVVTVRSGEIEQETKTLTAGAMGTFVVENLPTPRTYVLTFELEGYSSVTQALDLLPSDQSTFVLGSDVVLVGGTGTITGRVTDLAGSPLGGATVTVTRGSFTATTATLTTASDTAPVGGFELAGVPTPGVYTVTYSSPGLVDETRIVRFLTPGEQAGQDAALRPAQATISGRVADGLNGLAGVTVTLTDGLTSRTTTTASSPAGDYSFAAVEPGTYQLTLSLPGYRTEIVEVRMLAGEASIRNVAMVRS